MGFYKNNLENIKPNNKNNIIENFDTFITPYGIFSGPTQADPIAAPKVAIECTMLITKQVIITSTMMVLFYTSA